MPDISKITQYISLYNLCIILAFACYTIIIIGAVIYYKKQMKLKGIIPTRDHRFIWLIKELMKMYSEQPSFFSKKRVESGIAFFSGITVDLLFIWSRRHSISSAELLFHVGLLFGIAGYNVKKIQDEKSVDTNTTNSGNPPQ